MSVASRLDRLQRRRPWMGLPIAVVYKYFDDAGAYLAALVTYYAFVSLFPLLLIFTTVLGLVLAGEPGWQREIEASALRQFPVIGDELGRPDEIGGGTLGLVIGGLTALYGGLGVAQAVQFAMNTAWAVPRNKRPDPFKGRVRGLAILTTLGLSVVGTTALSVIGASAFGDDAVLRRIGLAVGSVVLNTAVFGFVFRLGTARALSFREVAPGAAIAAVAWQLLQTFGVTYVTHVIKNTSTSNGVFAIVLGLLAFLYLTAVIFTLCVELNVVRTDRLYPRALLTPFTDAVELTPGDERAYRRQAEAQRAKDFEEIDVRFEPDEDKRS